MNEDILMTLFDLSDELVRLRGIKKALEDEAKEVNKKINSTEFRLGNIMTEHSMQNFTRNGKMFYQITTTRYSQLADMKDELFTVLRERGHGELIQETINSNTLNSFVNEQAELNDKILPKWLNGLVSEFEKAGIGVKKAAIKK